MPRIEQAGLRQGQELLGDRAPEGVGIALLEIAAAAAAHQQGIAGDGQAPVVEHEAETAVGVAGGAAHLQMARPERHLIAVLQGQGHVRGADGRRQADGAAGGFMQQPAAGHVVGMGVGVKAGHQFDPQFADQREIALVLLEHRIDQHPPPAGHIGQQIGEGAGFGIKQLAHQQRCATGGSGKRDGGRG